MLPIKPEWLLVAHSFRAERQNKRRLAEELRPLPTNCYIGTSYAEDDMPRSLPRALTLPMTAWPSS